MYYFALLASILSFVYTAYTQTIIHAVVPSAGLGTRFLPFSKAVPKELVPLLNKAAIEYIIQEGIDCGITNFCIITHPSKEALQNYVSPQPELVSFLQSVHKEHLILPTVQLFEKASFTFVDQPIQYGLGHAIGCAAQTVGNNFFAVMLPDNYFASSSDLKAMIALAQKYQATVIGVEPIAPEKACAYATVQLADQLEDGVYTVTGLIEKPRADEVTSLFVTTGRSVFHPAIFDILHTLPAGKNNEIQLTDGTAQLIKQGHRVLAYILQDKRFDLGTPHGWLQANIYLAQKDPAYAEDIKAITAMLT